MLKTHDPIGRCNTPDRYRDHLPGIHARRQTRTDAWETGQAWYTPPRNTVQYRSAAVNASSSKSNTARYTNTAIRYTVAFLTLELETEAQDEHGMVRAHGEKVPKESEVPRDSVIARAHKLHQIYIEGVLESPRSLSGTGRPAVG